MTGQDVVDDVRRQVSDAVETYRWSDAAMLLYLDIGEREILRQHPEAAYADSIVVTDYAPITALTADLAVSNTFKLPLVHYISGIILAEDGEDSGNLQLANDHLQKFIGFMG